MSHRGNLLKVLVLVIVIIAAVSGAVLLHKRQAAHSEPKQQAPVAALTVTPVIAAGPNDVFEDVTAKAGIRFVHQFCDQKIANIIESNGAGAAWLDYNGDGL